MHPIFRKPIASGAAFALAVATVQSANAGHIKLDFPVVSLNALTTGVDNVPIGSAALIDPTTDDVRYPFALPSKPAAVDRA